MQPSTTAPAMVAPPTEWTVTVGGEGRIAPAWPGADMSRIAFSVLPMFGIRKAGTPPSFFAPRDSLGFSIFDLGQFRLGPVGKLLWPRKGSSDLGLNGLGDIGYTLQVGGFVEFWPVQWLRLRTEVRQGFGGENGVTGDLSADVVVPVGPVTLSGGPRLTLQSSAAVSPYFSITPTQSIASGLPVYSAAGGVYSYGGGVQARYFWSEQWATHAFLEYERLTGDAANSPLVVQRGSSNQFMYGLGTTYSFNMPSFW